MTRCNTSSRASRPSWWGRRLRWARCSCAPASRGSASRSPTAASWSTSSGGFQGQATDILIHARETEKLKRRLNEIYVKHTGRTLEEVEQALERDRFMSPEEAKEWGLIDEILVARGKAEPDK